MAFMPDSANPVYNSCSPVTTCIPLFLAALVVANTASCAAGTKDSDDMQNMKARLYSGEAGVPRKGHAPTQCRSSGLHIKMLR